MCVYIPLPGKKNSAVIGTSISVSVPSAKLTIVFISMSGVTDAMNCLNGFESLDNKAPESMKSLTVLVDLSPLIEVNWCFNLKLVQIGRAHV